MSFIMFPNWLTDLQLESARVPRELTDATARGVLWQAAPGRFLLQVPGVARYLVENGQRVTIERAPAADEDQVIRLARTTPLAALLFQRGLCAFHAAALAPPLEIRSTLEHTSGECPDYPDRDSAILLAGDSGAGKSTLLAALLQRGWRMLSDELACVGLHGGTQPLVFGLQPEVLLWKDALEKIKVEGLQPLRTLANGKQAFCAAGQFIETPRPLGDIYWLNVHSGPTLETHRLRGQKFFKATQTLLYNSRIAEVLLERSSHFRLVSSLTQTVRLQRINRPHGQWSVEQLADQIESDAKS